MKIMRIISLSTWLVASLAIAACRSDSKESTSSSTSPPPASKAVAGDALTTVATTPLDDRNNVVVAVDDRGTTEVSLVDKDGASASAKDLTGTVQPESGGAPLPMRFDADTNRLGVTWTRGSEVAAAP
jgi:hypothetical protein